MATIQTYLRVLNSIQGNHDRLVDLMAMIRNGTSDETINNIDVVTHHKSFDDLIGDAQKGYVMPKIESTYQWKWLANGQDEPSSPDDLIGHCGWGDEGHILQHANEPHTLTFENIDFDRICIVGYEYYFDLGMSYIGEWDITPNVPLFSTTNNNVSRIKIKARFIKDGVIGESYYPIALCGGSPIVTNHRTSETNWGVTVDLQSLGIFMWSNVDYVDGLIGYVSGSLSTNTWIFNGDTDADDFLRNGNYERAVNYHSNYTPEPIEEDETVDRKYHIRANVWERDNAEVGEKTYIARHYTEITVRSNNDRPFAMSVNENAILHLNVSRDISQDNIVSFKESSDGGATWRNVTLDDFTNDFWRYKTILKEGSKYVGCDLYTNIPIFDNNFKCNMYFTDLIDSSNAINIHDDITRDLMNQAITDLGLDKKHENELNMQEIHTSMSEIVLGSQSFFNELANCLNDDTIVNQIKEGLLMHSNPSDVFIDMFALPFNVENVVETSSSSHTMDFGTYSHTFDNNFKTIKGAKEFTMCTATIPPFYDDWRDYQCTMYLYLPYVNFIELNIDEFFNKILKVTAIFDVASATIKYFIKVDNVTVQTVEGSVRVGLPLSASNNVQGFMQKIGGASQIIQGVQSNFNNKVQGLENGLTGNIGGAIGNVASDPSVKFNVVTNIIGGVREIMRPTPKIYSGNYSSSCAFYDELQCYIVIERPNMLYDTKIINQYNLPDNRVSTLATCSGYTLIDNIDLNVNCSEDIRQEILQILYNGVYC